jgi:hypothetical protein
VRSLATANDGQDTRAIQHTVKYTELSPTALPLTEWVLRASRKLQEARKQSGSI